MICGVCGLDCGFGRLWWRLLIMKVVGCGELWWRLWVLWIVVEVVDCGGFGLW